MQKVLFSCKDCGTLPTIVSFSRGRRNSTKKQFRVCCPSCTDSKVVNTAWSTSNLPTADIYKAKQVAVKNVVNGIFFDSEKDAFDAWNAKHNTDVIEVADTKAIVEQNVGPDAFWAGFKAALNELDEESNPFTVNTMKHDEWLDGFEEVVESN